MYGYKQLNAEDAKGKMEDFFNSLEEELKRDYTEGGLFKFENEELEERALSMARGIRAFRELRDFATVLMESYCDLASDVKYMKDAIKRLEEKK